MPRPLSSERLRAVLTTAVKGTPRPVETDLARALDQLRAMDAAYPWDRRLQRILDPDGPDVAALVTRANERDARVAADQAERAAMRVGAGVIAALALLVIVVGVATANGVAALLMGLLMAAVSALALEVSRQPATVAPVDLQVPGPITYALLLHAQGTHATLTRTTPGGRESTFRFPLHGDVAAVAEQFTELGDAVIALEARAGEERQSALVRHDLDADTRADTVAALTGGSEPWTDTLNAAHAARRTGA